jgi:hypothetical protein
MSLRATIDWRAGFTLRKIKRNSMILEMGRRSIADRRQHDSFHYFFPLTCHLFPLTAQVNFAWVLRSRGNIFSKITCSPCENSDYNQLALCVNAITRCRRIEREYRPSIFIGIQKKKKKYRIANRYSQSVHRCNLYLFSARLSSRYWTVRCGKICFWLFFYCTIIFYIWVIDNIYETAK